MKSLKTFLCLVISIVIFSQSVSVSASEIQNTNTEPTKFDAIATDSNHIEITDKELIAVIAEQRNLGDPDKISKIVYDIIDIDSNQLDQEPIINSLAATNYYYLKNIVDLGDRFSFWDVYSSYWYDGYLENTKTFKMSAAASYNASIELTVEFLKSNFGVTINQTAEYSDTTKIIVPYDKRVNIKTWVNYQKKSYEVWWIGDVINHIAGTGTISIPVGLIIEQTYVDK